MNTIKQYFFNRFKTFSLITISILLSFVLLMIRVKLTHSFFYLFLVWNLFLAVIPFVITSYLVSIPKLNKIVLAFWFGVWLLFLPNAPYIITDLIHLRLSETHSIWLDILIVGAFAGTGLLLFYLSVLDMVSILKQYLKKRILNYSLLFIIFLSGFGVYLGRFLRYNSWELLSNPKHLIHDIFNIIIQPNTNKDAWLFTILFGAFLSVGFWVFNILYSSKTT